MSQSSPSSGHVFVVRGDITRIHCDARIIPAQFGGGAPQKDRWYFDGEEKAFVRSAPPPTDWEKDECRTFNVDPPGKTPTMWITKTGIRQADDFEYSLESAKQYLQQAAKYAPSRRVTDRELPLLALHIPGAGKKNAKTRLGDLVETVLSTAEDFVGSTPADVVLVANESSHYDALQAARQKRSSAWNALRESDLERAKKLAKERLCIFVGAGASASVGLPGWYRLLRTLAKDFNLQDEVEAYLSGKIQGVSIDEAPLLAAQVLADNRGDQELRQKVAAICRHPRAGLVHFQLTNLKANEYVTLNYDTLLEQAAASSGRGLDVLPHSLSVSKPLASSWLMKLHGCTERSEEIVLTKADYTRYQANRLAFSGLVQGLLLTQHMLFVGFGLQDQNVHSLVKSLEQAIVDAKVSREKKLGTALMVGTQIVDPVLSGHDWNRHFEVHDLYESADGGDFKPSARRNEMLLDALAAHSSDRIAHLLNPDFDAMLEDDERAVRACTEDFARSLRALPDGQARTRILAFLATLGLPAKT